MPTYSGLWTPVQQLQSAGSGFWPGVTPPGQENYIGYTSTSPQTYTWVAPPGITSVNVLCIGGGGPGGSAQNGYTGGGAGGGLGYLNNITVIPGNGYTVQVGNGGYPYSNPPIDGGTSFFISAPTVSGVGGTKGGFIAGGTGGGYTGTGGGTGGNGGAGGGNGSPVPSNTLWGGGGGAAGYSGNGGKGGEYYANNATAGSGGGGGGGGGGNSPSNYDSAGGGGGVGIYGQGANGAAGTYTSGFPGGGGGGGSGGTSGTTGQSSTYGGGGGNYGGGGTSAYNGYGNGAGGVVRIIWQGTTPGTPRTFPGACPDV